MRSASCMRGREKQIFLGVFFFVENISERVKRTVLIDCHSHQRSGVLNEFCK